MANPDEGFTEPHIEPIAYRSRDVEAPFKGLRAGAVTLGVIAILLGAGSGCLGLLAPLAIVAPRPKGVSPQRIGDLIVGALMYVLAAGALILLGIGSIRAKRWVRPVALIFGTVTILAGVYSLITMAVMLPTMRTATLHAQGAAAPAPPPQVFAVMMTITFALMAVLMLLVPAAFVWFYKKPDVKAMLDYFDPTPTWTDRCPLPVLGVVLAIVLDAAMTLISVPAAVVPAFGTVLGGLPAMGVGLLEVLVALVLAWLVFRLRLAGWWGTVGFVLLVTVSHAMTNLRADQPGLYRRAGYSEEQVEAMRQFQNVNRSALLTLSLAAVLLMIGYLLYVRRYFIERPGRS